MIDHSSRSTWGPGPSRSRFWVQKCVMPLLNHGWSITFVLLFCKVFAKLHAWDVRATLTPFWVPWPGLRVRSKAWRLTTDQVDFWVGALQLLFYKLCLKMIDHSSRNTWGPGPSRYRLGTQKCDLPPQKRDNLQLLFYKVHTKSNGWGCKGRQEPV
jgi:hypothetical protein